MKRRLVPPLAALALCVLTSLAPASAADGGSGVGDPYYPDDGNSGYDVAQYDVRVVYDPARPDHLDGDTTVTARALEDLDRFHLDLTGFDVSSVTVDGVAARAVAREGAHELVVTPARRLRKGAPFSVRVRYAGKPVGEGWIPLTDGGVSVVGEPHAASAWYPANDHPSDKATFRLTATVPDGWTAVGNGRPGPVTSDGAGHRTFRWYEDRPLVTYASTLAVDRFTVHTDRLADGTPVINAIGPGTIVDAESEALQKKILDLFSARFGPYPFSSAGAIVTSQRAATAPELETQSRPTYDVGLFDVAMAHELAHQWFGDSVSFKDWRDGCLAECFASYAQWLWYEHQEGDDIDHDYYGPQVEEHRADPEFWRVPLYDPGAGRELDAALYERGPLMLHALRRTVGDDVFFRTLRQWQSAHRYGNASWPQFEALAGQVSHQDLRGFFAAWAHSTVIPPDRYLYPGGLSPAPPSAAHPHT
ncbi:M1 family metallopeptidase [Streptomyces sp. NPDC003703]|uniref:M1 family metallopeptidase n=1 Tax=Streptomyces sp. NPDC003283 TaxID=3364681 RepID=UPI00367C2AA9